MSVANVNSVPPNLPILKHIGSNRKALDWNLFSFIISLIIVLITPTFPFNAPPNVLQTIACQNVLLNPNPTQLTAVPANPINSTRFLPPHSASAILPHSIAVTNCAAVKLPCSIPAWAEMVEGGRDGLKDLSW